MTDTTSTNDLIDVARAAGLSTPDHDADFTDATHHDFMTFFLVVFGYDLTDDQLRAVARASLNAPADQPLSHPISIRNSFAS